MIVTQGFEGPEPFSVVVWQQGGLDQAKTICYSKQEELQALTRLQSAGDFYSRYDRAVILRTNDEVMVHENVRLRGA